MSPTERDRLEVAGEGDFTISGVDGSLVGYERGLLKVLFDRVPTGLAVFEKEARLRRCNSTWAGFIERYTPSSASQVAAGVSMFDLAPDTEAHLRPILERELAGETLRLEGFRLESDGIVPFWDAVFASLMEDGEVVGFIDVAIGRQLVEAHGGRIQVESELAKRTTVTVELPSGSG